MARKILMTGKNAKYVNVRTTGAQPDDRQILMTGDNATFTEIIVNPSEQPTVEGAEVVEIKPKELERQ